MEADTGKQIETRLVLKPRSAGLSTSAHARYLLAIDPAAGAEMAAATAYDMQTGQIVAQHLSIYGGIDRSQTPPDLRRQPSQDEPQTLKAQQRRYREHINRKLNQGRKWPRP